MEEIWKDIYEFEDIYQVSNLGRVKFLPRPYRTSSKILSGGINGDGYRSVSLTKGGYTKSFKVSRLVANAFILNPLNLPEVNHKDENKLNDNLENLEWCTGSYNHDYGTRNKRCGENNKKPVLQYDKYNNFIKEYDGIITAEKEFGRGIGMCCRGEQKTAQGYIWRYKLED